MTFFFLYVSSMLVLIVFGEISLRLEQVMLSYRVSPGIEEEIIASNPSFPFWAPHKATFRVARTLRSKIMATTTAAFKSL